ncbi:MAG: ferredoxin [Candidatus Lokiarchaeota archaeon]|nr:ferredoxin [Candidatus Lokiarchaeota archaeon]
MAKYKIVINREECIACGNCYTVDPIHFESDDEALAQVVGGETDTSTSTGEFEDEEMEAALEAEEACPVSIIEVTKL